MELEKTHGVPNVLHGLEPLLHPGIRDWMKLVTPRGSWSLTISERSGHPKWWGQFRNDVRSFYRDAANRYTRAVLKTQFDAALKKLNVTHTFMAEVALLTEASYYKSFDDFAGGGETAMNAVRSYLQSRGTTLHEPPFERLREAGVAGAMQYIRYRYLADDPSYSKLLRERDMAALSRATAGEGKRRADQDDADDAGRLMDDWADTRPPHPIVLQALRAAMLRKQGVRAPSPLSAQAAALAWTEVEGLVNKNDTVCRDNWAPTVNGGAMRFVGELNLWRVSFALSVFCVDPLRLTDHPQ